MSTRVNAFAQLNEAPVFQTKPKSEKLVAKEGVDKIAEANNFLSRQPTKSPASQRRKRRVHRTGRNQHLSMRVTVETLERFYKAADARNVPMGELLKQALDALEKKASSTNIQNTA
jgi:hypothetical protein